MSTDLRQACQTSIEPFCLPNRPPIWIVVNHVEQVITRISLSLEKPDLRSGTSHGFAQGLLKVLTGHMDSGLRFRIKGTSFQKTVWKETSKIPPGITVTYGTIARNISCGSARAVGQALKMNPLPLIIPCHRVVGRDGRLTGFSCGIAIKKILIEFESDLYARHSNSGMGKTTGYGRPPGSQG